MIHDKGRWLQTIVCYPKRVETPLAAATRLNGFGVADAGLKPVVERMHVTDSWLFLNTIRGKRWHRVAPGFAPVTAFTICMLLATILHWERFDPTHLPFLIWLVLYVVTPFLVPFVWWRNRVTDPGTPEPGDQVVPAAARWGLAILGVTLLGFAVLAFIAPQRVMALWPWRLTPLTARIMGGWFALLGVGGLVIGRESRWSSWPVGLQAIGIWHVLVLISAVMNAGDFPGGLVNWYIISVLTVLAVMIGLIVIMAMRGRTGSTPPENPVRI